MLIIEGFRPLFVLLYINIFNVQRFYKQQPSHTKTLQDIG